MLKLFVILTVTFAGCIAELSGRCDSEYNYFLFSCYKIGWTQRALTMSEAQDKCREDHAELASVCTDQENDFIRVNMGPPEGLQPSDAWIGLRTRGARQRFFSDGNACPYRKWYGDINPEGRPKASFQNKDCTVLDSEGEWDVANCEDRSSVHAYVCKKRAGHMYM